MKSGAWLPCYITLAATMLGGAATPARASVQPVVTVNVTVDLNDVIRVVDDRHFGLNAAIYDAEFPSATTEALLAAAGTRTLRFPGGSLSDEYHWATNTTLENTWEWATSFDEFAAVADGIDAQVFITANYGTGTPEEAAAWVTYANVTQGYGFTYWEIGNESYGSWETDQQAMPHDPYTYAVRFKQYYELMKMADPTIKIGAVAITGEDAYANNTSHPATNPRTNAVHNGWTPVMLATMKALGVTPDFLIFHRYDQAPGAESDATLLQSAQSWPDDAADLRRQLTDHLGAAGAGVELVVTENNSVYSNPGKQTTSLVNGLFLADSLGHLLQTEFNAMVWWDVRNGQDTGNNNSASLYGWREYGDYGVLHGEDGTYPTYEVHKLLQYFARAGDEVVRATSDSDFLSVFAAKRADGSVALLVVNKLSDALLSGGIPPLPPTVLVNLSGFAPAYLGTMRSYGIAQDEAARTGTGSTAPDESKFAGNGVSFGRPVPLYSVSVISLEPVTAPVVAVAPASSVIDEGAGAFLEAQVAGEGPLTFQWFRNGTAISGATMSFYQIFPAAAADAGTYTLIATNASGSVVSSAAALVVGPRTGRFVNLSTRGPVRPDDELMIAGFVVGGNSSRTVLIRGVGPGLVPHGVTGVLADPHIRVFRGDQSILENDNWSTQLGGAPEVEPVANSVFAFPLTPGSADAALVATLDPGSYTVHVTGADGGTGVTLAEVYDVSGDNNTSRLLNISTRSYVGTGASIVIPGLVVGEAGRTLLLRGVGPGLVGSGISPLLPDPVIQVVDAQGIEIFTNDDWGSAASAPEVAAAAAATSAFALSDDSKDAAMIATLPPGSFTVLVSDKNGASGIAIVEAYEMAP